MDVLKPELLWVGGRCYRVNLNTLKDNDDGNNNQKQTNEYIEEDLYGDDDNNNDNYAVEQFGTNQFKTRFHVAQAFFALIIGSKGATKKRIEGETRTQIKIPKQGMTGDIEIIGSTRDSVGTARRRIDLIVLSSRSKQQSTHFLCVPITSQTIKENYRKFMVEILNGTSIFGLEKSLFQDVNKLHLTIGTLCLMDHADRTLAAQLLYDCKVNILVPIRNEYKNIELKMNGVEYMNDDPSEVDVLYGKIDSPPLQKIADFVMDHFIANGLMQRQYDHVKMHVTLINTIFRKKDENEENRRAMPNARQTFDAREILRKYGNFNFGSQEVTEIHLSLRHSKACDGFYEATATIGI